MCVCDSVYSGCAISRDRLRGVVILMPGEHAEGHEKHRLPANEALVKHAQRARAV